MRILFTAENYEHGQAAAVWRCRDLLKSKYGIDMETNPAAGYFDLELAHTHNLPDAWYENLAGPAVLLERIDGPQLTGPVRKHIRNPLILAVIKNTIYDSPDYYNRAQRWRWHEAICRGREPDTFDILPDDQILRSEDYSKLKIGFSFAAYPHMDPLKHLQPYELCGPRPFALHFAGTVDYGPELGWLNWHRRCAVEQISQFSAFGGHCINHDNRAMQFAEYFQTLRQSQFCVSPWGLGESCYRDFEAILSGCMVIKPDCTHILTAPGPFYSIPPLRRFICKPDFSDLTDIVANAPRVDPGDMAQWARHVSEQNSTDVIAGRLARIFRDALK